MSDYIHNLLEVSSNLLCEFLKQKFTLVENEKIFTAFVTPPINEEELEFKNNDTLKPPYLIVSMPKRFEKEVPTKFQGWNVRFIEAE